MLRQDMASRPRREASKVFICECGICDRPVSKTTYYAHLKQQQWNLAEQKDIDPATPDVARFLDIDSDEDSEK